MRYNIVKKENREILDAIDLKLKIDEGIDFIEALWDLRIVPKDVIKWVSSEDTLRNVKEVLKEEETYPNTPAECLREVKDVCKKVQEIYNQGNFYDDDREVFMGEANLAEHLLEIISKYEYITKKKLFVRK